MACSRSRFRLAPVPILPSSHKRESAYSHPSSWPSRCTRSQRDTESPTCETDSCCTRQPRRSQPSRRSEQARSPVSAPAQDARSRAVGRAHSGRITEGGIATALNLLPLDAALDGPRVRVTASRFCVLEGAARQTKLEVEIVTRVQGTHVKKRPWTALVAVLAAAFASSLLQVGAASPLSVRVSGERSRRYTQNSTHHYDHAREPLV